jgi:hypothetical protein
VIELGREIWVNNEHLEKYQSPSEVIVLEISIDRILNLWKHPFVNKPFTFELNEQTVG